MDHLQALHADHALLHALLTALVAPRTHLIVRTPEHDISLVARLVVWTLSSIFDYPTHRAKVRPRPPNSPPLSTKHFLKSLFFTNPSASSASAHTSQDESSDPTKARRSKSRHSRTTQHLPHARQPDAAVAAPPSSHLHVEPLGPSNVPIKSTAGRLHPDSLGVHYHHRNYILKENSPPLQPSRALVITGIEDATLESQRALARVMTDNRIVLDPASDSESWDLPDGFIVVYICPIDPRERPNIHHSLLDRFAMSCNVLIKPNLRQVIQSSIPPSNPNRPISVSGGAGAAGGYHSNTSSPLVNSHIQLPPPSSRLSLQRNSYHSASASASSFHHNQFPPTSLLLTVPSLPKNFISNLRKAYLETHISPTLLLYLNDLFSATRHRAELDGTFLTARCMSDAEKLARAHRVVGTDLSGMELLREGEDHDWLQEEQGGGGGSGGTDDGGHTNDDDDEDDENSDEQWQTVEADELSSFGISFNTKKPSAPAPSVTTSTKSKRRRRNIIPMLEVTEVNIARMFPRCVSHRVRVRDGPREEVFASMVFGATFDFDGDEPTTTGTVGDSIEGNGGSYEERPTVKDVLVSILSEV